MNWWLLAGQILSYVAVFALGCVARYVWVEWRAGREYDERYPK